VPTLFLDACQRDQTRSRISRRGVTPAALMPTEKAKDLINAGKITMEVEQVLLLASLEPHQAKGLF
jgi:hypothetical protein